MVAAYRSSTTAEVAAIAADVAVHTAMVDASELESPTLGPVEEPEPEPEYEPEPEDEPALLLGQLTPALPSCWATVTLAATEASTAIVRNFMAAALEMTVDARCFARCLQKDK